MRDCVFGHAWGGLAEEPPLRGLGPFGLTEGGLAEELTHRGLCPLGTHGED